MIKIALIGPESTGKTELCQLLAEHYECEWVPELARDYVIQKNYRYNFNDVAEIARLQIEKEQEFDNKEGNEPVFFDTDLIITKVWFEHKYGEVPTFLTERLKGKHIDFYLLLKPDLPWKYDPVRENGDNRLYFYEWYEREINELGAAYAEIGGVGENRLNNALKAIDAFLRKHKKENKSNKNSEKNAQPKQNSEGERPMNMKMMAKTLKGLEDILADELRAIGAENVKSERRAVSFSGDKSILYKANMQLRTAIRILVPINSFRARNADELYAGVKKINWEKYMDVDDTFQINSTAFSDFFHHSQFVTFRVKDGIADFFSDKYKKRPNVQLTNPSLVVDVHISHDVVTVSLDSSGESLHKRGYRASQTDAPISEVLAAGMIMMTGWRGECDFYDPMCGSGTLLIEAAMIALNIPPGIFRSSFAFEKWRDFDEELFQKIYNDESGEREFKFKVYGSDASQRAVEIAEQNVRSAGLSQYVEVKTARIQEAEAPEGACIIVSNPPYGERLETKDIIGLYGEIGTFLKHKFEGGKAWIISSDTDALKRIGLRPSKRVPMLNGALDCLYCEYEIFKGKRNEYLADKNRDKNR